MIESSAVGGGDTLADRIGAVVGGYRLDAILGVGGMGCVYVATHPLLGRRAAVKVLDEALAGDAQFVSRFLQEAKVVNDIRHGNIIDIFDFVLSESPLQVAYVMELVEGPTLGRVLKEQRLTVIQAVNVCRQLLDALRSVHAAGVVHRDLKPENVLVVEPLDTDLGRVPSVKILDFGIAKVSEAGPKTATGAVLGTPTYMAPEQIAGDPVSPQTDLYAVAEMFYEMVSGVSAFTRGPKVSLFEKLSGTVPDLPLPEDVPAASRIRSMVKACLQQDPSARPSAAQMISALDGVESEALGLRPPSAPAAPRRPSSAGPRPSSGTAATQRAPSLAPRPPSTVAPAPVAQSKVWYVAAAALAVVAFGALGFLAPSMPSLPTLASLTTSGPKVEALPTEASTTTAIAPRMPEPGQPAADHESAGAGAGPATAEVGPLAAQRGSKEKAVRGGANDPAPTTEARAAEPPGQGATAAVAATEPPSAGGGATSRLAPPATAVGASSDAVPTQNAADASGGVGEAKRWYAQATARSEQGQHLEAVAMFTNAIERAPSFAAAFDGRGRARQRLGDIEAAIRDFDQAIDLDPGNPTLRNNRALAHHASGARALAIADLDRAIELAPDVAVFYENRSAVHRDAGDLTRAAEDLDQAINYGDAPPRLIARRARLLQKLGDHAGAIEDLDRVIAVQSTKPDHRFLRGHCHLELKHLDAAVSDFSEAIRLDSGYAAAYLHRALAHEQLGDKRAAAADLRRFLELDPTSKNVDRARRLLSRLEGL